METSDDDALHERSYEGLGKVDNWLAEYHRDFRTQISDADRARGETRGRMMLLSAAIVGLVVPHELLITKPRCGLPPMSSECERV